VLSSRDGHLATLRRSRACSWQRMLDDSFYATSESEIDDAENISKSYVSRILRLALLAPEVIEQILDSRIQEALPARLGEAAQAVLLDPLSLPWRACRPYSIVVGLEITCLCAWEEPE
jgi:hypothetical protein